MNVTALASFLQHIQVRESLLLMVLQISHVII